MTNEEWLENTRPDGNVDPQPELEPELPEGDYSQVEEEPVEKMNLKYLVLILKKRLKLRLL